jgi:hypothetical protein
VSDYLFPPLFELRLLEEDFLLEDPPPDLVLEYLLVLDEVLDLVCDLFDLELVDDLFDFDLVLLLKVFLFEELALFLVEFPVRELTLVELSDLSALLRVVVLLSLL